MIKILSLVSIYAFSFLVFLTSHSPVQAVCSIVVTSSPPYSAGGQITVRVTSDTNGHYESLIVNDGGTYTAHLVGKNLTFPGDDTITSILPSAAGAYRVGVWRGVGNQVDDSCGQQSFTVQTNLADCEGLLGCTAGINTPGLSFSNPRTLVGDLISRILPIVLGIIGFITVIVIVVSGIQFITSSGNPEAAAGARGRLTFAIIGFVIVLLAYVITRAVDIIFLGGSGVF